MHVKRRQQKQTFLRRQATRGWPAHARGAKPTTYRLPQVTSWSLFL